MCDMPEPCEFPSLDSCQKRFLWTHKEVDHAPHPVFGRHEYMHIYLCNVSRPITEITLQGFAWSSAGPDPLSDSVLRSDQMLRETRGADQ